ncbi:MAG: hypothetical protein JWO97_4587 [Acidobacteria bacterium]|nr:hypothetical protein [Acidobacteriota bacterium]
MGKSVRFSETFAKLFYSFPTIPPRVIKFESIEVHSPEQVVGLLWLVDLLQEMRRVCFEKELEIIFRYWWPSERRGAKRSGVVSTVVKKLRLSKLITLDQFEHDQRMKIVRLTPLGERLLKHMQADRLRDMAPFMGEHGRQSVALRAARELAEHAWSVHLKRLEAGNRFTFDSKSEQWIRKKAKPRRRGVA